MIENRNHWPKRQSQICWEARRRVVIKRQLRRLGYDVTGIESIHRLRAIRAGA